MKKCSVYIYVTMYNIHIIYILYIFTDFLTDFLQLTPPKRISRLICFAALQMGAAGSVVKTKWQSLQVLAVQSGQMFHLYHPCFEEGCI